MLATVHAAFAEHRGRLVPESGALRETPESVRARIEREDVLVAEAGTDVVGCVFVGEHGGDFYLGRLSVVPERRGRGIAGMLVAAALQVGRARGFDHAVVGTRLRLPGNIGFFAAHGFRVHDLGYHEGVREPTFLWLRRPLAETA